MQGNGVQGTEEKPPGSRCSAAYIGMNTAIPADMSQNNPMADLHTVHVPGQVEIIQMNPFSSFFRASWLATRQWRQFIHRRITAEIAYDGQLGILQNQLYQRTLGVCIIGQRTAVSAGLSAEHYLYD